jgi:hypothetical protein
MLLSFDKYQNVLIIGVLLLYILNTVFIQSNLFSIILFVLFVLFQFLRLRKNIQKLSLMQIGIIVMIFIDNPFPSSCLWLNHLDGTESSLFPTLPVYYPNCRIVLFYSLTTGIHKLYLRFTQQKIKRIK